MALRTIICVEVELSWLNFFGKEVFKTILRKQIIWFYLPFAITWQKLKHLTKRCITFPVVCNQQVRDHFFFSIFNFSTFLWTKTSLKSPFGDSLWKKSQTICRGVSIQIGHNSLYHLFVAMELQYTSTFYIVWFKTFSLERKNLKPKLLPFIIYLPFISMSRKYLINTLVIMVSKVLRITLSREQLWIMI